MNDRPDLLPTPAYFSYYKSPVKMVRMADGGLMTWRFDPDTGGWEMANDILDEILFAVGGEISVRSKDAFIQEVEAERALALEGEGPIFALYETIDALMAKSDEDFTDMDAALVKSLRRRTYAMFEAELVRRGDPGADVEAAREAGLLDSDKS